MNESKTNWKTELREEQANKEAPQSPTRMQRERKTQEGIKDKTWTRKKKYL